MTGADEPRILPGCSVLPPMEPPSNGSQHASNGTKPKGKLNRRHTADRFAVLNAFADCGARLVDTTAQACWWIIYRETKPDGLARVSQSRVAECVGVSRLTATRALGRLERAGLLTIVRRGGLREGTSTYRVHGMPKGSKPAG